jgi:hypothetical protein
MLQRRSPITLKNASRLSNVLPGVQLLGLAVILFWFCMPSLDTPGIPLPTSFVAGWVRAVPPAPEWKQE